MRRNWQALTVIKGSNHNRPIVSACRSGIVLKSVVILKGGLAVEVLRLVISISLSVAVVLASITVDIRISAIFHPALVALVKALVAKALHKFYIVLQIVRERRHEAGIEVAVSTASVTGKKGGERHVLRSVGSVVKVRVSVIVVIFLNFDAKTLAEANVVVDAALIGSNQRAQGHQKKG